MSTFEGKLRGALGAIPSPALTTLISKEYSDEGILQHPTYSFSKQELSQEELINLSNKFYAEANSGFISNNTSKMLLLLALNLRRTDDPNRCILTPHRYANPKQVDISDVGVKRAEAASSSEEPDKAIEKEDLIEQIDSLIEKNKKPASSEVDLKATLRNIQFGPFVAAYLIKSVIKQVTNVSLGMPHMKERYLGFYPETEVPNLDINMTALTNLQNKLKFDKIMINTWIFATADYEYVADATEVDSGVIRYLANLQFSFSAMPAYNLFRELLIKSNGDPADWIIKLWTDSTKGTLLEVHKILGTFESTIEGGTTKKKSKYFKYARVIDPQYFLKLQPGQSLCLIYLLARVLNHYQNYNSLSNPDKIAALSKMGDKQKEFLRMLADVIIENEGEEEGEGTRYAKMARDRYKAYKSTEERDNTERDILMAMAEG